VGRGGWCWQRRWRGERVGFEWGGKTQSARNNERRVFEAQEQCTRSCSVANCTPPRIYFKHRKQQPRNPTTQVQGFRMNQKMPLAAKKSQGTSFKKTEVMSASLILRFHPIAIAIANESAHDKRSKTQEACERNRSYDLCLRDTRTAAAPSKREASALRVDAGQLHGIKHKQEGTHKHPSTPLPTSHLKPPPPPFALTPCHII